MTTQVIPLQTYRVILHEAEEGGYWAEVLGLPGCVSQGETPEEVQANIREAIEAVLNHESTGMYIRLESAPTEKDTRLYVIDSASGNLISATTLTAACG